MKNYENEYWEAQAHIGLLEGENRELREECAYLIGVIDALLAESDDEDN